MNPTKKQILAGEEILRKDKKHLDDVTSATTFEGLRAAIQNLYEERIHNTIGRLTKLKDQWAVEFEKESAEANTRMPAVLANSEKYITREPKAIADKIKAILEKYKDSSAIIPQEERNDDFYDLIDHIKFMNKNVKPIGSPSSETHLKATTTKKSE